MCKDRISGNVDWQKKAYTFSGTGTKILKWRYVKDSSTSEGQDCGRVDGLVIGEEALALPPNAYSEAVDSDLYFVSTGEVDWILKSVSVNVFACFFFPR